MTGLISRAFGVPQGVWRSACCRVTRRRLSLAGLSALAALAGAAVVAEVCLRYWWPQPKVPAPPRGRVDSVRVDARLGYEIKPNGVLATVVNGGTEVALRASSEGFIGPERQRVKPPGVVRIMAVGDSVVAGLYRIADATEFGGWPAKLEQLLSHRHQDGRTFEVINAGVGGYTAWQTRLRFETRGMAFAPDIVVVLVGWNDLAFSARSDWHPYLHYYEFEPLPGTDSPGLGSRTKAFLLRHSHLARVARDLRLRVRAARPLPRRPAVPFNQTALDIYAEALEGLHGAVASCGAQLALVLWPTPLLAGGLCDDAGAMDRQAVPPDDELSAYRRYADVQRDFARKHPSTILIDPNRRFTNEAGRGNRCLFADGAHLTPAGNALLAEVVQDGLGTVLDRSAPTAP